MVSEAKLELGGKEDLSVNIASIKISNPTILASGVLGISLPILERVVDVGAGAVVTKSIGTQPIEGHKGPTVVEVDSGYLNAIGLSNPGVEAFSKELREYGGKDIPLIISIFGSKPSDFEYIVSRLQYDLVKAFELNLSCPHVKGVGVEVGHDPAFVSDVVKVVKKEASKPIFVKLSPNVGDIVAVASAAEEAGADAITAINTARAMAIDIETQLPILSNRIGGLSGRALKPIALRCVYEIYENVKIPIIGCGGVTTWEDAVEFILAGANAVQIGTAVAYRGLEVFSEVARGLEAYLERKGVHKVNEIVGAAHRQK